MGFQLQTSSYQRDDQGGSSKSSIPVNSLNLADPQHPFSDLFSSSNMNTNKEVAPHRIHLSFQDQTHEGVNPTNSTENIVNGVIEDSHEIGIHKGEATGGEQVRKWLGSLGNRIIRDVPSSKRKSHPVPAPASTNNSDNEMPHKKIRLLPQVPSPPSLSHGTKQHTSPAPQLQSLFIAPENSGLEDVPDADLSHEPDSFLGSLAQAESHERAGSLDRMRVVITAWRKATQTEMAKKAGEERAESAVAQMGTLVSDDLLQGIDCEVNTRYNIICCRKCGCGLPPRSSGKSPEARRPRNSY